MSDLIDRDKLLEERPEYLNEIMEDELLSAEHRGWNKCNSSYWHLITEQPTANNWISVLEKLPNEGEEVFLLVKSKVPNKQYKTYKGKCIISNKFSIITEDEDNFWGIPEYHDVIAWMSIPQYKE